MRFARVTFAAHDMNAFADLGQITLAQYRAAPEGPQNLDDNNSVILDLMRDENTMLDEKFVTAETAAALLGWPALELIQRGRQAVARGLDEDAEYLRTRRNMTNPAPPVNDALLAAAKRVLAKLEHETASVTLDDQLALSRAVIAAEERAPSPTADEARKLASWLHKQGIQRGDEDAGEREWCDKMQRAAALLSRIPIEEATEEERPVWCENCRCEFSNMLHDAKQPREDLTDAQKSERFPAVSIGIAPVRPEYKDRPPQYWYFCRAHNQLAMIAGFNPAMLDSEKGKELRRAALTAAFPQRREE